MGLHQRQGEKGRPLHHRYAYNRIWSQSLSAAGQSRKYDLQSLRLCLKSFIPKFPGLCEKSMV